MDDLGDKSEFELLKILESNYDVNHETIHQLFNELIKRSKSEAEELLLKAERLAIDLRPNYLRLERYSNLNYIKENIGYDWILHLETIFEKRDNLRLKSKYADLLFCLSNKDVGKGERAIQCFERVKSLYIKTGEKKIYRLHK